MTDHVVILMDESDTILGTVFVENYDEDFEGALRDALYEDPGVLAFDKPENEGKHLYDLLNELYGIDDNREAVAAVLKAKGYTVRFTGNTKMELN